MSFDYCTVDDVKNWISGLDVSEMPSNLDTLIEKSWIPWAKREIDTFAGENFDLTTINEFYDGSGRKDLVLRHKPISFVRNVTLRIIPQIEWFQFKRWFHLNNTDQLGTVVAQRGGVNPKDDNNNDIRPPYLFDIEQTVPDDLKTTNTSDVNAVFNNTTEQYENADLFVDCKDGILTIPPRILFLESQAVPFWNYTWLRSTNNIEIEYDYGYKDINTLPFEIRTACAQLTAAAVLQNKGLFYGAGATSLTLSATPKSFGNSPHSGHIQSFFESAKMTVRRYKRIRCGN